MTPPRSSSRHGHPAEHRPYGPPLKIVSWNLLRTVGASLGGFNAARAALRML